MLPRLFFNRVKSATSQPCLVRLNKPLSVSNKSSGSRTGTIRSSFLTSHGLIVCVILLRLDFDYFFGVVVDDELISANLIVVCPRKMIGDDQTVFAWLFKHWVIRIIPGDQSVFIGRIGAEADRAASQASSSFSFLSSNHNIRLRFKSG